MRLRVIVAAIAATLSVGCSLLEDNGTHLAYALEKGAKTLRASPARELVVQYEPLDGTAERYRIEITPSLDRSQTPTATWGSYLVVSGRSGGGTSYHNRFVFVPQRLTIEKERGATAIVLQKAGDRIDVVALR